LFSCYPDSPPSCHFFSPYAKISHPCPIFSSSVVSLVPRRRIRFPGIGSSNTPMYQAGWGDPLKLFLFRRAAALNL